MVREKNQRLLMDENAPPGGAIEPEGKLERKQSVESTDSVLRTSSSEDEIVAASVGAVLHVKTSVSTREPDGKINHDGFFDRLDEDGHDCADAIRCCVPLEECAPACSIPIQSQLLLVLRCRSSLSQY